MLPVLVASLSQGSVNTNGFTTAGSLDTTPANFLATSVTQDDSVGGVLTDSEFNVWNEYTTTGGYASIASQLWYVVNPATNAAHKVSISGSGNYPALSFTAWGSVDTVSPLDGFQYDRNTSLFTGSVQPTTGCTASVDGALYLTTFGSIFSNGTPATIDDGFTVLEWVPTQAAGCQDNGIAYLIQGTAATVAPTWTSQALAQMSTIMTFKGATGGGGDNLFGQICM